MVALTSLAPCRSASGRNGQIKAPRAKFHAPSRLQCYGLVILSESPSWQLQKTMEEPSLYSTEEHFRASRA
eukprot:5224157-Pleurochrysis_carterae.AAC.1